MRGAVAYGRKKEHGLAACGEAMQRSLYLQEHFVGVAAKGFQVGELILNQAVDGFHIALVNVRDVLLGAEVSDGPREVRAKAVGRQLADSMLTARL
jgi:hypothetical protein